MMVKNIVIAGAGIVGNSIAYYLSKNYVDTLTTQDSINNNVVLNITVIDPVGICPGASGKAGGFLAKEWRDGTDLQDLHRLGFHLHEELSKELHGTDYRRLTCMNAAVDGDLLQRKHSSKKVSSTETPAEESFVSKHQMEWIDDSVMLESQELGNTENIAQVHPKKLCEKMWEYSESKGATLRIGKVVKALPLDEYPHVQGVQLDDGTVIDTDVLVVAIGPWTEEIRSWFQAPTTSSSYYENALNAHLPFVYGVKSHSMLVKTSQTLTQAVFFQAYDSINDIEVYPRPDGDSYITGSSHPKEVMMEHPGQEAVEMDLKEELLDAMRRTSPDVLGAIEPHTVQACYWPETMEGMPIIGSLPGVPNVVIATGHSVWGILQGPSTGLAVAEYIMEGEARSIDLQPFSMASEWKSINDNSLDEF